jgi:hypothetical protein
MTAFLLNRKGREGRKVLPFFVSLCARTQPTEDGRERTPPTSTPTPTPTADGRADSRADSRVDGADRRRCRPQTVPTADGADRRRSVAGGRVLDWLRRHERSSSTELEW